MPQVKTSACWPTLKLATVAFTLSAAARLINVQAPAGLTLQIPSPVDTNKKPRSASQPFQLDQRLFAVRDIVTDRNAHGRPVWLAVDSKGAPLLADDADDAFGGLYTR